MRFPIAATLVVALAPALAGQEPTDTEMLTPVVVTATRPSLLNLRPRTWS